MEASINGTVRLIRPLPPIHGFMHIAITPKTNQIVTNQITKICRSPLYNQTTKITLGVVGGKLDLKLPPKFKIEYQSDNLHEYEFPTLSLLQTTAKTTNSYLYYIHTKGATWKHGHRYADRLRYMMETAIIDGYKVCIWALQHGCNTAGLFQLNEIYPGNFWWATSQYINTLPPITTLNTTNRHEAERWIKKGPHPRNMFSYFPQKYARHYLWQIIGDMN